MATNTIFDDNFSGYSPGGSNITGFFCPNGFVVDFGTMTGSSSATGFYERSGKGLVCEGNPTMFHQELQEVPATEIVWAGWSGNGHVPVISVDNVNLSSGTTSNPSQQFSLGQLTVNTDLTMSFLLSGGGIYSGLQYVQTTVNQVVYPYTWQYFQAYFAFSPQIVISVGTVVVTTCVLAVDGTIVIDATGTSNILVSGLWTKDADCNQWRFLTEFGNGYLGDITGITATGTSTLPPISQWPHPGSPLQANYTQGVVELAAIPTLNSGRITQGVVEIPAIPTSRAARITQGVVEIIFRPSPTGGWLVYEA